MKLLRKKSCQIQKSIEIAFSTVANLHILAERPIGGDHFQHRLSLDFSTSSD